MAEYIDNEMLISINMIRYCTGNRYQIIPNKQKGNLSDTSIYLRRKNK